ncbi:MAG: TonB-dependent receptor [Cyclobacteriaceae bacterium]
MRKLILGLVMIQTSWSFGQDSLSNYYDSLWKINLAEIAVTAVRASASSPVTSQNIDRKEIQGIDFGQDASLTLEGLSPSIITFSDAGTSFGNYHQFRLRGIDQTRINITLNGVPLNDMMDQGVFFSNFSDFSSSMESIQVQRGIGISTNGTASYAGSVSYESFDIFKEESVYRATATAGSFGSFGLKGEAFSGIGENGWGTYFRASRLNSDGYKRNSGSDAHSFYLSTGKQFENSLVRLTAFSGRAQNQQAYSPVLLADIQNDPRTNYFPSKDQDDFRQELIQLQYGAQKGSTSFNVTGYYGGARGYFPFTFGDQFIYSLQNTRYGALANVTFVMNQGQLTGGIHAYQFDRINESATVSTLNTPYYSDTSDKKEFSQFWKWEQDIGNFTLLVDAQFRAVEMSFASDTLTKYAGERVATRKEEFINPKVGLTYRLGRQSNVYASFGRTGREPTRVDLMQGAFDGVESWNYQAFTDKSMVKSEFVNDLEMGYRYASKNFNISVNGFYMAFENEISQVGGLVENSYFALRQNVKNSQRMGLELDTDYSLENGLSFGLMATYMRTKVDEFDTGTDVLKNVEHVFAPKTMVLPSAQWTNKVLTVGLDARLVSESFMELSNDPEYVLPAYTVLNMQVAYNLSDKISLRARINNLLNELYFTDGAPVDVEFDGTPEGPGYRVQAPRNFIFSASYQF